LDVPNRLLAFNACEDIWLTPRRKHDFDERVTTREELVTVLLPVVHDRYRAIVATAGGAGLRWGEAAGLCADTLDLDQCRLRVIRTIIEVSGQTGFKPFPKSAAGRRTVLLPPWLVEIIQKHREAYPLGESGLAFPNAVGKPLHRTLFRSRVWRPALVRAGMLAPSPWSGTTPYGLVGLTRPEQRWSRSSRRSGKPCCISPDRATAAFGSMT
jgi:integrase